MKKNYFSLLLLSLGMAFQGLSQTASWTALTSGTSSSMIDVFAQSPTVSYVCGNAGIILKTTDGGTIWTPQTSGTTQPLHSIFFTDANNGYVVGDDATARRTTNGGTTWTAMTVPVATTHDFRYVYFIDSNTGFITGGISGTTPTILKTTNGGTTWTSITVSSVSSNAIYSLFFTSATDGYATDFNGKILKTTNTGVSWSALVSGTTTNLQTVYFTDVNTGIVTGDNGTIRTTSNAGTTWSGVSSGTTTDYLTGIDFYNSTHGFVVGGNIAANAGIILSTTDGGATWSTYNTGGPRLLKIDLVNANLGYAVGLNGTILKYSSNVGIIEKETKSSTFKSYPNPFNAYTVINCNKHIFQNEAKVEIYDITGKIVRSLETTVKDNSIPLTRDNLVSGIYFYKIFDNATLLGTGKMIVE